MIRIQGHIHSFCSMRTIYLPNEIVTWDNVQASTLWDFYRRYFHRRYLLLELNNFYDEKNYWWISFNAQEKGNVCLRILNSAALGNVETNVLGGNETLFCFASFLLWFCQANSSTNMEWMNLGGLISRSVEACS